MKSVNQAAPSSIKASHVSMVPQIIVGGAPIVQGEPVKPIVVQCRPPSKIGCVINSPSMPVVQGEPVKLVVNQPVTERPVCGEIYYNESATPDIGLIFTMIVAGILGNCR